MASHVGCEPSLSAATLVDRGAREELANIFDASISWHGVFGLCRYSHPRVHVPRKKIMDIGFEYFSGEVVGVSLLLYCCGALHPCHDRPQATKVRVNTMNRLRHHCILRAQGILPAMNQVAHRCSFQPAWSCSMVRLTHHPLRCFTVRLKSRTYDNE